MKETTRQILTPLLHSDETITPQQIEMIMGILDGLPQESQEHAQPEPYISLKEVARRLNISACSLWRWGVPGYSLGGRRRFRLSEVEEYLHSDKFKRRAEELKKERRL